MKYSKNFQFGVWLHVYTKENYQNEADRLNL